MGREYGVAGPQSPFGVLLSIESRGIDINPVSYTHSPSPRDS